MKSKASKIAVVAVLVALIAAAVAYASFSGVLNISGKALGVFGVVLSWGMQAKDDYEKDKQYREIRSTRERIRASFNDAANSLVNHYKKTMSEFMDENYNSKINDIDKKIMEIRALRVQKTEAIKLLEDVQAECKHLIVEIHENH